MSRRALASDQEVVLLKVPQRPVELILMRQLGSSLALPVVLVDAASHLVFVNDHARTLLGPGFDVEQPLPLDELRRASPCPVTAVPLQDATGSHLGTLALLVEEPPP